MSSKASDFIHTSDENPFEALTGAFESFFRLDKEKIQAVINLFNKKGANVSYVELGKVTGLDVGTAILRLRTTIAFLIHCYLHHKQMYKRYIATTEVSKDIITGFEHFVEKLDKRGLAGLDLLHMASQQNINKPLLAGVTTKNFLAEIQDESDKVIGYLPIVTMKLSIIDEQNEIITQKLTLTYDDMETLIQAFETTRQEAKASAKHFQEKLGDSVIFAGDE